MKFRIIKNINYNKFGDIINTVYTVKQQTSFLGIKYWKYVSNLYSSIQGGTSLKWETTSMEKIEKRLNKRIIELIEEQKTKRYFTDSEVVKEVIT